MNEATIQHEPTPLSRQRHIARHEIDALILERLGQSVYCTLSSGLWRLWRSDPTKPDGEPECLTGQTSRKALVEWIESQERTAPKFVS